MRRASLSSRKKPHPTASDSSSQYTGAPRWRVSFSMVGQWAGGTPREYQL